MYIKSDIPNLNNHSLLLTVGVLLGNIKYPLRNANAQKDQLISLYSKFERTLPQILTQSAALDFKFLRYIMFIY